MKYALIIPDGVADEPQASLNQQTPLQAAYTPFADAIARSGIVGRADNTPPSMPSGSDVATMSLFGYSPLEFHTGRAPLEAAAQGIALGPYDWAIRCNLVTIHNGTMVSFTSEQIPNDQAAQLVQQMQSACGSNRWEFHTGVSYRNLLIYRGQAGEPAPFGPGTQTTPPHDLTDGPTQQALPAGHGSELLLDFMSRSQQLFANKTTNPSHATQVWLWGQGQAPALTPFLPRFGVQGVMITAVDLLRGLAKLLGWKVYEVAGATGYLDTDYAAKGREAVAKLDEVDLIVVHVEATDEASHEGLAAAKVTAMEQIDQHIIGPVWQKLQVLGDHRILISPDHPTFLRTKTHSYGWVPFALSGTGITADAATAYDEASALAGPWAFPQGWDLMEQVIRGAWSR